MSITAMQELITHLEMLKNRVDMVDVDSIIEYATNSLEKEKQKMFHCFNAGADRVCDKEFNQWFDQTYTQNK